MQSAAVATTTAHAAASQSQAGSLAAAEQKYNSLLQDKNALDLKIAAHDAAMGLLQAELQTAKSKVTTAESRTSELQNEKLAVGTELEKLKAAHTKLGNVKHEQDTTAIRLNAEQEAATKNLQAATDACESSAAATH